MRAPKSVFLPSLAIVALMTASAVSAQGKKNGNGGGGGGDPPDPVFTPAIAYLEVGRKSKDLKLSNRAGDAACLVVSTPLSGARLSGFEFHAAEKVLAYSIGGQGIFLASWDDDPCTITNVIPIRAGVAPESMDFSPDGRHLVWRETTEGYTGFGTAAQIFTYDRSSGLTSEVSLEDWGGVRPEWGVDREWGLFQVHFSPDFENSNELIFVGGALDGSLGVYQSLFAYDMSEGSPPRKLLDGSGLSFDYVMSVTNPGGQGEAKVAFTDNDTSNIVQLAINDGGSTVFSGYEPEYSCDNSEIIHRTGSGRRTEVRITSTDGGASETWSKADLRFFDWFCP